MDITNQLIESFGKFDSTLNALDQRLVALGESVDKFNESTNKATDNEEKKQKKLTDYEKKRLQFEKKYDKEIKSIQKRFATAISVATKTQTKLNQLNEKYNKGLQSSIKNTLMQNKVTGTLIKGVSMFKDAMGVAAAKLKDMPVAGAVGRGIGGAGRAAGSLLGKMGKVLPMASILAVPAILVRQLMKVDQTMADIAANTGLVGKNLAMVQNNVVEATSGLYAFGINLGDAGRQASALVDSLGNAELVTSDLIKNTSLIAKATGMSAQEAGELTKALVKGFGATAEDVESFTNNMMSFAATSGVNARKVMRDISNDSNLTSIYLGRGEDALMKSAVLAAKMGKSMAEQNQTLDAFSTIESSVENVAEINRLTGANLDAQKMFMLFMQQDVPGTMRELQKAFGTGRAQSLLKTMPGAFKNIAGSLNMSVTDLKNLDTVMQDFDKSTSKADKSQEMIKQSIKDSTTILDTLKNLLMQSILPAFNNIGQFLVDTISPAVKGLTDDASSFGESLQAAMSAEDTFSGKISAAFTTIIDAAKPTIMKLFDDIMAYLEPTIERMMNFLGDQFSIMISENIGFGLGKSRQEIERENLVEQAQGMGISLKEKGSRAQKSSTQLREEIEQKLAAEATDNASAMGNVIRRPTMALVGEEGRSEVIIPTERIRKGLPVSSSVARELSSIGVPGFALGATTLTSAQVSDAANTFALRQQENALLSAQGSNEAIRRVESKIEQQAAAIRKEQRALVNDVMMTTLEIEEGRYDNEGQFFEEQKRRGNKDNKLFKSMEKGLHSMAKGLNNFMTATGTTFKDIYNILPENFRKTAEKAFGKLPDEMQKGLTVGVQTAYDTFLETGSLQEALKEGAIAGIRAGTAESGGLVGVAGELAAQLLEGKGFRGAIAGTLKQQQKDKDSLLNTTLTDLGAKDLAAQEKFDKSLADIAAAQEKQATGQDGMRRFQELAEDRRAEGNEYFARVMEDNAANSKTQVLQGMQQEAAAKKARNDAIKSQAKTAGAVAGIQGAIRAFEAGEGLAGVAKTGISSAAGAAAGAAATGGLMAAGVPAPVAKLLGDIGGGLVSAGVGKALGFFGLGGKNVKPKNARKKIKDVIMGNLVGVTTPGFQLSKNFAEGSAAHKVLKANFAIAGTKNPEKMFKDISDAVYDVSGLRYSTDKSKQLAHVLYGQAVKGQERTDLLNAFESEMESGVERAGASGAIVSRPTVALIGEAGPEALMPLENAPGASPLNGVGGGNSELIQEIKRMNQMLGAMANRPITLDGQRVNAVLNTNNSDDIRSGIYTVNSR